MSDLRTRVIRLAHAQPQLRPALLPLLREAGVLVPMVTVYLSVIPLKGNTPFNSDHLFDLEKVYVRVKGGGSVGVLPLDAQRSKSRFTWDQEKAGYKNETVVEVRVPRDAAARALAGIRSVLGGEFTVRLLPARRLPEDQIPAGR
mgnify:FL=1